MHDELSFWKIFWKQFGKNSLGVIGLVVVVLFCLVGIYAPFLASSKPFIVEWNGTWYFPLFRYLFYQGFFSKRIDLFFNLMIFTFPVGLAGCYFLPKWRGKVFLSVSVLHLVLFGLLMAYPLSNPASSPELSARKRLEGKPEFRTWQYELDHLNTYAQLNLVIRYHLRKEHHGRLEEFAQPYGDAAEKRWLKRRRYTYKQTLLRQGVSHTKLPSEKMIDQAIIQETPADRLNKIRAIPTLWERERERERAKITRQEQIIKSLSAEGKEDSFPYRKAEAKLQYLLDKREWLETEEQSLHYMVMPLVRTFHWEDDAGGEQSLNQYIPWWELTRVNRKDLVAALIFGVRISLVVGCLAVLLALIIGVPIGALAGFYGGKFDIAVSRLLEIWESMPTFFMLLMVVAITQTKSIFLVISVVGLFGWTGFSRYIRGEFFKQRHLPYVEACHSLGYGNSHIIFSHILPNAVPPLLTLLPFAIMGAITSEAGLSFLGLGEEGSCSWGVLMDEGRSAFPGESYLLWPPALLLTTLLIAIALVGDAMRDALDPKLH